MILEEYIPLPKASKIFGIPHDSIRSMCYRKTIRAHQEGSAWRINSKSLINYIEYKISCNSSGILKPYLLRFYDHPELLENITIEKSDAILH